VHIQTLEHASASFDITSIPLSIGVLQLMYHVIGGHVQTLEHGMLHLTYHRTSMHFPFENRHFSCTLLMQRIIALLVKFSASQH